MPQTLQGCLQQRPPTVQASETHSTHACSPHLGRLRHGSMQAITTVASRLLKEGWSIREDLYWAHAANVQHPKKRSKTRNSQT
mmetsp:Transcript_61643/g.102323  ORF Transcript_61643/g.102323 Transcript_61643/m.102323 type:complete len:83 (-) Transcript_61643:36-284(-)